jgi:hypothetical protein
MNAPDLRTLLRSSRAELRHGCSRMLDLLADRAAQPASTIDVDMLTYAATFTRAVLEAIELAERLEPQAVVYLDTDTVPCVPNVPTEPPPPDETSSPCGECGGTGRVLSDETWGASLRSHQVCHACLGQGCT